MSNLKDAWIEIKNHVVRNKERYIVGAVVVTGVVITVVIMKKSSSYLANALATSLKHHAPEQLSYLDCPETVPADVLKRNRDLLGGSSSILLGGLEGPGGDATVNVAHSFFNRSPINNITLNNYTQTKGHPGFLTRCVETGDLFATQQEAATAFSIQPSVLSSHLNSGTPLREGLHFERVGVLS